jgi:hypothetical protein
LSGIARQEPALRVSVVERAPVFAPVAVLRRPPASVLQAVQDTKLLSMRASSPGNTNPSSHEATPVTAVAARSTFAAIGGSAAGDVA